MEPVNFPQRILYMIVDNMICYNYVYVLSFMDQPPFNLPVTKYKM